MMIYHMNFGYPLLDEGSRLYLTYQERFPTSVLAQQTESEVGVVTKPDPGYVARVYNHTVKPDGEGFAYASIVNEERKLGATIKFKAEGLPKFNLWKCLQQSNYEVYQREIQLVKELCRHYKGKIPVIPTMFLPAHCVPEFCGGIEKARYYFDNAPDALETMLKALVQTELQLVDAYIEAGADGFFFATRYSNWDILSEAEFERFCRPFDELLLERVKGRTWFNILHIHGEKNFFMDKILISGTDQFFDFYGSHEEVKQRFKQRLRAAAEESGDNRFIFAPGCSLPLDIELEHVHLLREVVDEYNDGLDVN